MSERDVYKAIDHLETEIGMIRGRITALESAARTPDNDEPCPQCGHGRGWHVLDCGRCLHADCDCDGVTPAPPPEQECPECNQPWDTENVCISFDCPCRTFPAPPPEQPAAPELDPVRFRNTLARSIHDAVVVYQGAWSDTVANGDEYLWLKAADAAIRAYGQERDQ